MAALKEPSAGNVLIDGEKISPKSGSAVRHKIGILFQDPDDQIFMPTVEEDIAFGPTNLNLDSNEIDRRIKEAIIATGLQGYEKRAPHHLSIGEKKRVAIAGVLSMRPKTMLLDEPTSGLDPKGKEDIMKILDGVGETMVLVTHDVDLALDFSDRTILLKRRVIFDGSPLKLFENESLIESAGLVQPKVTKIVTILKEKGLLDSGDRPKSIDELRLLLRNR